MIISLKLRGKKKETAYSGLMFATEKGTKRKKSHKRNAKFPTYKFDRSRRQRKIPL